MKTHDGTRTVDLKAGISTLWIVVTINVVVADIFSFMLPGFFLRGGYGGIRGGISDHSRTIVGIRDNHGDSYRHDFSFPGIE